MSANRKISNLPNVIAASIQDTDILPIVASGVTSNVKISDLRVKLGVSPSVYFDTYKVYNVKDHAAVGDNATDDTTAITNTITLISNAGRGTLYFPPGIYKITGTLELPANCTVRMGADVQIRQAAAATPTFQATTKDNVWIQAQGGLIYGEGSWSSGWSDFASHNDRGAVFRGCTNSGIVGLRVQNMAMAGIVILGGSNIYLRDVNIEGTHALGHALTTGVSIYQFGIVVMHDTTYGAYTGVHIDHPTIFNVAMGINSVENIANSHGSLMITGVTIYSFIAQHALYIGTSNTYITGIVKGTGLDGLKLYSGANNEILRNVVIILDVSDCTAGQAVEFGVSGTGKILSCSVTLTAYNCARALVFDGDIRNCMAHVTSDTMSQYAFYMAQGAGVGPVDCDITVISDNTTQDSIQISAATSARNRIRAKVAHPSTGGGSFRGFYVNACASLTVESLEAFDDATKMAFGLYLDVNAANVRMTGTFKVFGYVTAGVSANGTGAEWHATGSEFTSLNTAFHNQGNRILPVTPIRIGRQTTVNANVPLWQLTLDDESAYHISLKLVGKLSGSAERKTAEYRATYWRDAAGVATLQGTVTTVHSQASAGFAGTNDLATPTVNDARLLVNSAAAVIYDWVAEVQAMKISP